MSLKKIIIKNVVAGWFGRLTLILSIIVTTPILISHLGKYEYGIWLIVGQGSSLLMLLDFGIANSISRFVSKNVALKNDIENIRVYSTAIAIFSFFSILIIMVLLIIIPFIPDILSIEEGQKKIIYWVFGLTGLNVAIMFPLRVGRGLLQAKDKYDLIALIQVIYILFRLILIVIFFEYGNRGLVFLASLSFVLNLSSTFTIYYISTRKYFPKLKFKINSITKKNFKEMASLGNSAFLQTISGFIWAKLPPLIIGIFLGVGITPLYSIPNSILLKIGPFITRLGATFTPIASRLDAENKTEKLIRLNLTGVRYGLVISIPICIFILFFGDDLLYVWLGESGLSEKDINLMSQLLRIMVIPFALGIPQIATRSIFNATGRHWVSSITQFGCSLIGIGFGILLMIFTDLGIVGIAIGWSLKIVLSDIVMFPFLGCTYFKMSGFKYFKDVYMCPLFLGFVLFLSCLLYENKFVTTNIFGFLVCSFIFGILALIGIYFIGMLPEHRIYINESFRRGIRRYLF